MSILDVALVKRRVIRYAKINGVNRAELPEYRIYMGMITRCKNPNVASYKHYGGRGIRVCDRWLEDFKHFYDDMGARPSPQHSIDRIDNDGNYEPSNCRWATPKEQSRNKRPGGRCDAWTAEHMAILTRMWNAWEPVEKIALVLGRTVGSVRLRTHFAGLRRDVSFTRLSKKHPDLAPILTERGPEAFLTALKTKVAAETAEKERQRQAKAATHSEVVSSIMAGQGDRNSKMRALRLAGCDLSEIGKLFGLTRERVRQIQLLDFRPMGLGERKVSATRPENRAKHVDRLARAWNLASVEARLAFLDLANADPRADLPRLIKGRPGQVREAA